MSPPPAPSASDGPAGTAGPPGPGQKAVTAPADLDLVGIEADARQRIGEMAYAYYAGGAEDELLVEDNQAAWRQWRLQPRTLTDVTQVSTATTLLGTALELPVLLAPTAIQRMAHPDGEVATARGAAAGGTCLVLSSVSTRSLEDVAAAAPDAPRWMQIYVQRDRARTVELVHRAVAAGYRALVLTVDAPVSGLRRRELRGSVQLPDDLELPNLAGPSTARARVGGFVQLVTQEFDPSVTDEDIGWLADLSGLPVLVKGVLRADDATRAVDAGAAGVIVSNHGGRQLDDAPATADVLAGIAEAVGGRAELLVDGGIRRPNDVVKALALGARAVLIGRPAVWALATGGADGVTELLGWFAAELRRSMALCGARNVFEIDRSLVQPAGRR